MVIPVKRAETNGTGNRVWQYLNATVGDPSEKTRLAL